MVFAKLFVLVPEVEPVSPKKNGKKKSKKALKTSKMNKHTALSPGAETFEVEINKNSIISEPESPFPT